jgi:hypothetical protein
VEQPGSPTPSDTPEAGAPTDLPPASADAPEQGATATGEEDSPGAPNPDAESANEGSGTSDPAATLDEMYLTLGHLVAAHDLSRADAEKRLKDLSATEQDLQKQREDALASGDHMAYANAIRGLNEVSKIADLLQNDAEDNLRATDPEHQDGDSPPSERDSDGDPGSAGGEQSVADQASLGVGERGDGDPDGDLGRDDDPSGGSDSGGTVPPEH